MDLKLFFKSHLLNCTHKRKRQNFKPIIRIMLCNVILIIGFRLESSV